MDRSKLAGILVSTVTAGLFLLLGGCWIRDRSRHWETPRLDPGRFPVIHDGGQARSEAGWEVVPVNLRCPHCLAGLRSHQRSRLARAARSALVVLVVDTEREPSPASVARLRAERVWWDRFAVWRQAWGHRLYGEVLRFDARGRYLETLPPPASDHSAKLESPPREGGESP